MSWFIEGRATNVLKLGTGQTLLWDRREWSLFYTIDHSPFYEEADERDERTTKQFVFFRLPNIFLKVVERHSVAELNLWNSSARLFGIYLTMAEAVNEIEELDLHIDPGLSELLCRPYAKLGDLNYLHYLLTLAINRLGHLRNNSVNLSLKPLPVFETPKLGPPIEKNDVASPGAELRYTLPQYEISPPKEVIFREESVWSVIEEIAVFGQRVSELIPQRLLDELQSHAGFLIAKRGHFLESDVDALGDCLTSWQGELLLQLTTPPKVEPPLQAKDVNTPDPNVVGAVEPAAGNSDDSTEEQPRHELLLDRVSIDGKTLHWLGKSYPLTTNGSRLVAMLLGAREKGDKWVSQDFLMTEGPLESEIRNVVRDSSLGTVVVRQKKKDGKSVLGSWGLADPDDSPVK